MLVGSFAFEGAAFLLRDAFNEVRIPEVEPTGLIYRRMTIKDLKKKQGSSFLRTLKR